MAAILSQFFAVVALLGLVLQISVCNNVPKSWKVPFLDGRIVGGKDTTIEAHPYQLSLQTRGRHKCGASLLKPNIILTAAHCVSEPVNQDTVRGGSASVSSGGQVIGVKRACTHPSYPTSGSPDYDVAVLLLKDSFTLGSTVQLVELQPANDEVEDGAIGTVTGWGTLEQAGSVPSVLQEVDVSKVSHGDCVAAYAEERITDRMICFGEVAGGKDSCQGDSGGPMVVNGKQVGIVSWGYGCARPEYPGVYTKISNPDVSRHIENCIKRFESY